MQIQWSLEKPQSKHHIYSFLSLPHSSAEPDVSTNKDHHYNRWCQTGVELVFVCHDRPFKIYFSITQSRNIYSLNFKRYSFFEQNCPSSAQVSVLTLRLRRRFSMASAIGLRERRRRRLPASDSISAPETISTITVPSRSSPDLSPCPMPHQVRQTMSTIVHQTFLYAQCRIK